MRSGVMRTRSELATETGAPFPASIRLRAPEVIRQREYPLPPLKTHLHAHDVRV